MFSLQPCDELGFATPTTPQQHQIPHHLISDHSLSEGNLITFSAARSNAEQRSRATNFRSPQRRRKADQSSHECNDRRVMHREIEKRRRQQMSKLYLSLRALLPNKERSSVCDQLEEAESYIRQMHKNIEELRNRRDDLKKSEISSSRGKNVEKSDGCDNCVAIHEVGDGLEILISSKSPDFELSRVLAQLVERELDVFSCVSTRTKGGFLHKFDTKARDMKSLDVMELHDRLVEAICQVIVKG